MFNEKMKKVALSATAITALSAGAAAAQEACTNYTVQDGDTMATIAIAAYGTSNYQPIFNANRNEITNPNALEPGLVLALPCEDGSLPNGQSAQEIIAAEEQRAASVKRSSVYQPPIKLVTGNGWAPFADESLNGGGAITRLGTTALQRGGNARDYSVSFVDDWNSHLETLLPLGAFDVSMAWNMPDCTNRTYEWSWETEVRCTQFDSSVPVYDIVVGFYTIPESQYANATTFEELKGATICRMDGWFIHDLEQEGLHNGETMTLMQPITARECLDAVLTGTADVATFEVQLFSDTMVEMGLNQNDLVENPYVTSLSSLRFISHRSNPFGKQYLAMLNKGLNEMRETGEWYAIVSDTLREHNEKLMAASN
ncbi:MULTISPECIES: transporter substrate-binding domain-containing protein [unclassified Ruegeria]|uniref:LysM peptidoglycan-binding domain-containing protein n=1 Tax=unclassified Ruegeria TaxID=2625375 RepID=UPI0014925605|nr:MULTISPECIES: transporter substrate-binding domain-containing protein [unclassified Ruegeria]NOD85053.1 transporter substrate-binding domain-containing protein [Ruegeria sp. HKCCD6119]